MKFNLTMASELDALVDIGAHDAVLDRASAIASHLDESGDLSNLMSVRAAQTRILVLRGQAAEVSDMLDWIESTSRELGDPQALVSGLGSVVSARGSLGDARTVAALLTEIEASPSARDSVIYPALLSAMVRATVNIGDPELGEQMAHGLKPRYPYSEHAIVMATATLTEARGDLGTAAEAYGDAIVRWEAFGVVPEQAFALLGLGRCLLKLTRPTEATPALNRAREIFERLLAAPALSETEGLLQQATSLST